MNNFFAPSIVKFLTTLSTSGYLFSSWTTKRHDIISGQMTLAFIDVILIYIDEPLSLEKKISILDLQQVLVKLVLMKACFE